VAPVKVGSQSLSENKTSKKQQAKEESSSSDSESDDDEPTRSSLAQAIKKNDEEWKSKFDKQLSTFSGKMAHLQETFGKQLSEKDKDISSLLTGVKSNITHEAAEKDRSLLKLKKKHQKEVETIFEDNKTLSFIQKMRGFKQAWHQDKAVTKRKQTAGQMAEATKNWISSYE
jgi:hypothetical protein